MAYLLNFTGTRTTIPNFASSLSGTSLANFNAAADGELVMIDSTNYTALLTYATTIAGMNNTNMTGLFGTATGVNSTNNILSQVAFPAGGSSTTGNVANFVDGAIPFLMRTRIFGTSTNQVAGVQLGYHTNSGTGVQAGTAISSKSVVRTNIPSDINGFCYYVVKNPSVVISGTDKVPRYFSAQGGNPYGIRYSQPADYKMYQASSGCTDVTGTGNGSVSPSIWAIAIQVHSL